MVQLWNTETGHAKVLLITTQTKHIICRFLTGWKVPHQRNLWKPERVMACENWKTDNQLSRTTISILPL